MTARLDGAGPSSGRRSAVVVGGGLAGVAAAVALGERGVRVTLLEKETFLGGRAGAWTEQLPSGEPYEMERGFHAFFRQYYNVRALLRRVDPTLSFLTPLPDYPLLGPDGRHESFAGLPRRAPFNLLGLVRRTPTIRLADLARIKPAALWDLFAYDATRTYARFDGRNAKEYLDSLGFPDDARRMLFEVFAHSFFNPEEGMSAAELLMMFHFYFTGNPEGLVFDVLREPFSTALWKPMERYLASLGVDVRLGAAVTSLEATGSGFRVAIGNDGATLTADAAILALPVPALKSLVASAPTLRATALARAVASLEVTLPFAVQRLWLDRPVLPERAAFAGTAGLGLVDNISVYERFEGESRAWAERTGGSVVEVHAYAVPTGTGEGAIRAGFRAVLDVLYPETKGAKVLHERFLLTQDCPAFAPGSHERRPGVSTDVPGLALAGDFVRLGMPSALMERAVASGFLAANDALARWGIGGETVHALPSLGLLRAPVAHLRSAPSVST